MSVQALPRADGDARNGARPAFSSSWATALSNTPVRISARVRASHRLTTATKDCAVYITRIGRPNA